MKLCIAYKTISAVDASLSFLFSWHSFPIFLWKITYIHHLELFYIVCSRFFSRISTIFVWYQTDVPVLVIFFFNNAFCLASTSVLQILTFPQLFFARSVSSVFVNGSFLFCLVYQWSMSIHLRLNHFLPISLLVCVYFALWNLHCEAFFYILIAVLFFLHVVWVESQHHYRFD